MTFSLIPFLLLVVPLAEIAAFVLIGGQIGIMATLGLVLLTAIIGTGLLRWQGFGIMARIQAETQAGRIPGKELAHGAMILVAGVLLLTPGFVTDTMGFLLFVPAIRNATWRTLRKRITVVATGTVFHSETFSSGRGGDRSGSDRFVDLEAGEFHREAKERNAGREGSESVSGKIRDAGDGQDGL